MEFIREGWVSEGFGGWFWCKRWTFGFISCERSLCDILFYIMAFW